MGSSSTTVVQCGHRQMGIQAKKFKADGSLERYKARLVLCGFTQRPGVDFAKTFSQVIKPAKFELFCH